MKKSLLSLLLAFAILFQQGAAAALCARPHRKNPAHRSSQETPLQRDMLANINQALIEQTAGLYAPQVQAQQLQYQVEKSLQQKDLTSSYQLQKELNNLLLQTLSSSFIENRIFALEMLAGNIEKGLISYTERHKAFRILKEQLTQETTCENKQCKALGLSALLLSFSLAEKPLFLHEAEAQAVTSSQRNTLTQFFAQLLTQDYGSDESNNIVAPYILRALGYAGGAKAVAQALERLIEQSSQPKILWGATRLPKTKLHLNEYDVANAPAQKAALQILASLAEDGKAYLEYYAAQNRGLLAYTHANIELAYLGETDIPVHQNLTQLFCHYKWNLDSQKDFELKQEIAYAYGQGKAPSYFLSEQQASSCHIVLPTKPDPRLTNIELTERLMGEILFIGGGEFLAVFAHAGKLRRLFEGLRAGKARVAKAATAQQAASLTVKKSMPFSSPTLAPAKSLEPFPFKKVGAGISSTVDVEKQKALFTINMGKLSPNYNTQQKRYLNYLEDQIQSEGYHIAKELALKEDFSVLAHKRYNSVTIVGNELRGTRYVAQDMSDNFLSRIIEPQRVHLEDPIAEISMQTLADDIMRYGKMSSDSFVRWFTHGSAVMQSQWTSGLAAQTVINIEQITGAMQKVIESGTTRKITLWLDSCFSGTAFDEFLKLPAELRKNINLFAPVGRYEMNYLTPTRVSRFYSPLEYARNLWTYNLPRGLGGRAYIDGRIINPMEKAILTAKKEGSIYTKQMELLHELSRTDSADDVLFILGDLENAGMTIKLEGDPWPSYIFSPNRKNLVVDPGGYELIVPQPINQYVLDALETTFF